MSWIPAFAGMTNPVPDQSYPKNASAPAIEYYATHLDNATSASHAVRMMPEKLLQK
jgi:hypothetical protein